MKKKLAIFLVVLSLFLTFMTSAEAAKGLFEYSLKTRETSGEATEACEDDAYVVNTFFRFANSLADVSFSDVKQYLVDQGYTFYETIGDNDLATFHVECPVSEVYFCFYPLDVSPTSTAFGDPDREMLSCIEYSRGDKWITVTDEFHAKTVQLIAGDRNDNPVRREISDIDILRLFYNYEIGGNISYDAVVDVEISTDTEHVSVTYGAANLVSAEDFMYHFNFYSALFGDGHVLSMDNAYDFDKVGDGILYKTILNDCEILTLMLSSDATQVKRVYCTWAFNTSGANDYLNDFLQMLMESLLACGMESDSISSLFSDFGKANAFSVGDKGERIIDGIKVSYEVTSYGGVSFVIERE